MKLGLFHGLAAVVCAAGAVGCSLAASGTDDALAGPMNLTSLEQGSSVTRTYLGTTQVLAMGDKPVVGTFDLLGGAQVEIEIATRQGQPVRFELWQVHVGGSASMVTTVDSRSGFALESLHADQDSSWAIRFLPDVPAQIVVRIDCTGSTHGCTPFVQPGERCPAGWQCDEGLTCVSPGNTCELTSTLESHHTH
ncbi:MAG TPA: hypothetical protein VF765_29585 [Polyangiaceae bacterium]